MTVSVPDLRKVRGKEKVKERAKIHGFVDSMLLALATNATL
jgi:hypothetical protein